METLIAFFEKSREFIDYAALTGGLLNAGGLFLQGYKIRKTKDISSMSLPTFFIFLFIQVSYLLQSLINRNLWLGIGMIASAIPTCWIIFMAYYYRNERNSS